MASHLAAVVRLSIRQTAVWRECERCGKPTSLPSDRLHCTARVRAAQQRKAA
jgi:hypothetical protein